MTADVESRLYRADSWLNRAREPADHLDGQFIFQWIALNAWYGQRGSEKTHPRGLTGSADATMLTTLRAVKVDGAGTTTTKVQLTALADAR